MIANKKRLILRGADKIISMSLKRVIADGIFLMHSIVIVIVLFGWVFPSFWYIYIATLASTPASEVGGF